MLTAEQLQKKYDQLLSDRPNAIVLVCAIKTEENKVKGLYDCNCDVCGTMIVYKDKIADTIFLCPQCLLSIKDLDVTEAIIGNDARIDNTYDAM